MLELIVFLLIGGVAGLLARLLVPGRHPLGVLGTILLGVVGSFIGGTLGTMVFDERARIESAGLLGSIVGAVLALLIYDRVAGRRRTRWFRRRSLI